MKVVYAGAGALFIMKNFAGGVLNMGLALELAGENGYQVQSVLVNDDVAVNPPSNRRGLGATILVEKIAGAAAEEGKSLDEVTAIACEAIAESRSMGAALTGCTVPAIGRRTYQMPEGQFELGVGMHGERGRYRVPYDGADQLTELLAQPIIEDLGLAPGDDVLAMVSGLGGTPLQELQIVFRALYRLLAKQQITVVRNLVGNYITSLDSAGCSITLLRLSPERLALWDAPVHTPTLRW
jgi:dihydroxyacetone kinase-like protein